MSARSTRERPSYRVVNYSIRPAKSIQRKMLCDAFRRLKGLAPLHSYRYVGFGSVYFSDFSLFHRRLGITNMVTLEMQAGDEERVRFNKPFSCIEVVMGHSNEKLGQIGWSDRSIVWLDYDHELSLPVLRDVETVCARAVPDSLLLVTVDAEEKRIQNPKSVPEDDRPEGWDDLDSVRRIERILGTPHVPLGTKRKDLFGHELPGFYRRVIVEKARDALRARNGGLPPEAAVEFVQLFYFRYRDGAEMLTVGGALVEKSRTAALAECGFDSLAFCKRGDEPYLIYPPNLTFREMKALDKHLPTGDPSSPDVPVQSDDKERYRKLYRYFPHFAEAEL